jgi:hypothetical protein
MWRIELEGEAEAIEALQPLAPVCDCMIAPGADGRFNILAGPRFDRIATPEELREEAGKVLMLLNGLARLQSSHHEPVQLGASAYALQKDGSWSRFIMLAPGKMRARPRTMSWVFVPPGLYEKPASIRSDDIEQQRRKRLVSDPQLAGILEAIAGEKNWQRLRVAFEKINHLVGKGDNALVSGGYATQGELDRFKANVQDPRHSGLDAVHGVPTTPVLKGTKMTVEEGFAFVARLLNTYLDKKPA